MPFAIGQVLSALPDAAARCVRASAAMPVIVEGEDGLRPGLVGRAAFGYLACCQGDLAAGPGASVVAQLCLL